MYTSVNLPLDRKKIIKKTLGYSLAYIVFFVFGGLISFIGTSIMREHGLPVIVAGILVAILPLVGCYLYQLWYYKLYSYEFGEIDGEISKGVISRSTGHVQYSRIQNIYVDQDFLDRIFGLYDVHYETAGDSSGIYSHVDGLNKENAGKLVSFLREKVNPGAGTAAAAFNPDSLPASVISRSNTPVSPKLIVTQTFSGKFFIAASAIGYTGLRVLGEDRYDPFVIAYWCLGIIIAAFLGLLAYNIIWFKNFDFGLSESSLVVRYQVISKSQDYVSYDRIQNITIKQGILERMLGLYSVIIETAAAGKDNPHVILSGLSQVGAQRVRDFLSEKTKAYRAKI